MGSIRLILKSRIRFQTKIKSTQFNYHYISFITDRFYGEQCTKLKTNECVTCSSFKNGANREQKLVDRTWAVRMNGLFSPYAGTDKINTTFPKL